MHFINKWPREYNLIFCHFVLFQVTESLGRWILEPLGIYNAFIGVTSNQSESFNAVLKISKSGKLN